MEVEIDQTCGGETRLRSYQRPHYDRSAQIKSTEYAARHSVIPIRTSADMQHLIYIAIDNFAKQLMDHVIQLQNITGFEESLKFPNIAK